MVICDGLGTTHAAPGVRGRKKMKSWWEAHGTSGVHLSDGTGTQGHKERKRSTGSP